MSRSLLWPGLAGAAVLVVLASGLVERRLTAAGELSNSAQIGGAFALTDGDGKPVTSQTFPGNWRLIYFGYTHCPDACPTTLSKLGAALDKLPAPARSKIRVLFITVDPARDTPKVMGDYAKAFGPEFVGLTGSAANLATVDAEFHVYAKRHDLAGGDYAMDHSSIIYVMAPDGSFSGLLDDSMSPDELARRLGVLGA